MAIKGGRGGGIYSLCMHANGGRGHFQVFLHLTVSIIQISTHPRMHLFFTSLHLLSVKNPTSQRSTLFFELRLIVKEKEGGGGDGDGGLCCMESLVSGLGKDRTGCV